MRHNAGNAAVTANCKAIGDVGACSGATDHAIAASRPATCNKRTLRMPWTLPARSNGVSSRSLLLPSRLFLRLLDGLALALFCGGCLFACGAPARRGVARDQSASADFEIGGRQALRA